VSRSVVIAAIVLLFGGAVYIVHSQLPAIGAGALLHPGRRMVTAATPGGCIDATIKGAGVELAGWRCAAIGDRRGTLIYLHGVADNRESAIGAIRRFTRRGFDVIAYDSRAHGNSGGQVCTYGFYEKEDLRLVIDGVASPPIVLVGASLGAAVALQYAPSDPKVRAVVAAETFSDLRTVANERAPFVFTRRSIEAAFALAEQLGAFDVDAVSPVQAAANLNASTLLIHGDADRDTPPSHSERVLAALAGPKQLILVPGGTHNRSLVEDVWVRIERWLDDLIPMTVAQ
jgi:uncharacterized protein